MTDLFRVEDANIINLDWSPDESELANGMWDIEGNHSAYRNIYVVDRDGSNIRQLTDGLNDEDMPSPPSS